MRKSRLFLDSLIFKRINDKLFTRGAISSVVERFIDIEKVAGSIPASRTMKNFSIIAAIDKNRGIGKKNGLPWHLKKDMRHFAEITTGSGNNAVIMGRNTWLSLPEKFRPLPKRLNIVLSFEKSTDLPNEVLSCQSLDEALKNCEENNIKEIFVIGGGQIFATAINHPNCEKIYLTEVAGDFNCDIFFPAIPPIFKKTAGHIDEDDGYQLDFAVYEKIA